MDFKKLSLAHLETASLLLPSIQEEGGLARVVALYLADAPTAAKYRTDNTALDAFLNEANCMDGDECGEVVNYFFERWQSFQNGILKSVGVPVEVMEKIKANRLNELMGGTPPPATQSPD